MINKFYLKQFKYKKMFKNLSCDRKIIQFNLFKNYFVKDESISIYNFAVKILFKLNTLDENKIWL